MSTGEPRRENERMNDGDIQPRAASGGYQGTDRDLWGLVAGIVSVWLFGHTFNNIGPAVGEATGMSAPLTNVAVSLTSLLAGMLLVGWGSLADRRGRMRMIVLGNVLNVVGCLMIAAATGTAGPALVIAGRALEGLAQGAITPAVLATVNLYWQGRGRDRAISCISIGSFGGAAVSSFVAGALASSPLTWRAVFVLGAAVSVLCLVLVRHIPESRTSSQEHLDIAGITSLAVGMLALQLAITYGPKMGPASAGTWALVVVCIAAILLFIHTERTVKNPLIDLRVFRVPMYTGAIMANFFLTSTAGLTSVTLWVLQLAGGLSTATTGTLTLGYAVGVLLFVRLGERIMRRRGVRMPILLGAVLILVVGLLRMTTFLPLSVYVTLCAVAFVIYGVGIAVYATPLTTAALRPLPQAMAGTGMGAFKMASSLGSAIGLGVAGTIFTTVAAKGTPVLTRFITFQGAQNNVAVREAGIWALGAEVIMCLLAIVAILVWIRESDKNAEAVRALAKE
ncbi:MFS transporter [Neoactinobaculum massilliense]|uniref:MFS transporter n=1 Tax=Neoactinobaculum massilliense TaxID=2364794 RepID=UPI000F525ED5|nr:MFS transporter [Neoactinobaculum massilliense]